MVVRTEFQLQNGTKVIVEGTEDEVIRVSAALQITSPKVPPSTQEAPNKITEISVTRTGPVAYITELVQEGFFSQPRSLSEVKTALAERGHPYPIESLSGPIVKVVQQKLIRRFKDGGSWEYVNR